VRAPHVRSPLRRLAVFAALALAFPWALPARADAPAAPFAAVKALPTANGLRVSFVSDPSCPAASIATVFAAGRRHEGALVGLAEHVARRIPLASRGTAVIAERLGVSRVEVGEDTTTFVDTVPAGEIALALWTAAERLRGAETWAGGIDGLFARPKTEAEHLRALVLSEDASTLAESGAYARRFAAQNAVVVITGPFEEDEITALIRAHLDGLGGPALPRAADETTLPEQTSRRSAFLERPGPRRLYGGFAVPGVDAADHAPLELALLVLEARVRARSGDTLGPFVARLRGRTGVDVAELELELGATGEAERARNLIERELGGLAAVGPTALELTRARARAAARRLDDLATSDALAATLARREALGLPEEPAIFAPSGESADIARVVRAYLGPMRGTFLEPRPAPSTHTSKPPGLADEPPPPSKPTPSKVAPAPSPPKSGAKPKSPGNKPGARR